MKRKLKIVITVLFISLVILVPLPFLLPQKANVKITYPQDQNYVAFHEVIKGTSSNLPKGEVIWITIFEYKVGRYYPMANPVLMGNSGSWSSAASFGGNADINEPFDVIAVLANETAQNKLISYNNKSATESFYGGFNSTEWFALGTQESDRITVKLNPSVTSAPMPPDYTLLAAELQAAAAVVVALISVIAAYLLGSRRKETPPTNTNAPKQPAIKSTLIDE